MREYRHDGVAAAKNMAPQLQPGSPESGMPLSPRHLAALNQLVDDVLGISFSDWAEAGFWDNRFTPRMLFDGEDAVANVSVYSIDMVIQGEPCRAAQIATCATREDRRNQGLGSTLLAESLAQVRADHDLVFVMSTDRAVPFYRRQGFEPVLEQIPTLVADRTRPKPGLLPLDVENRDDLALIADKASTRTRFRSFAASSAPNC